MCSRLYAGVGSNFGEVRGCRQGAVSDATEQLGSSTCRTGWFQRAATQRRAMPGLEAFNLRRRLSAMHPQGTRPLFFQNPHLKHPHGGPSQALCSRRRDCATMTHVLNLLHCKIRSTCHGRAKLARVSPLRTVVRICSHQALSAREPLTILHGPNASSFPKLLSLRIPFDVASIPTISSPCEKLVRIVHKRAGERQPT